MFGLLCLRAAPGDFRPAYEQGVLLAQGRDPYSIPVRFDWVSYPLTATLVALPFLGFKPDIAGALFAGISSGLLAFAMARGGAHRLLVFLCYPFWSAMATVQWSPLLMAASLLPWLFPAVIVKPNLGLAVVLRSGQRAGLLVSALLAAVTVVLLPNWPLTWLRQMAGYQSFFPVASGVGILLLVLVPMLREHADARFLISMALVPQRWFYDALLLWLVPETIAEFVITGALSWGAALLTPPVRNIHQVATLSVCFNYLPMLGVVLVRRAAASGWGWSDLTLRMNKSGAAD